MASCVYVFADVAAAIAYPAFHSFARQTISELMARGAPTEHLVDPIFLVSGGLLCAFALGVWLSGSGWRTRLTALLVLAYAVTGFFAPTLFKLAPGPGAKRAAFLHFGLTTLMAFLVVASVATGIEVAHRWFRTFSRLTLLVMFASGGMTLGMIPGVSKGDPPWLGLAERAAIGAFLAWVAALAAALFATPAPPRRELRLTRSNTAKIPAAAARARAAD